MTHISIKRLVNKLGTLSIAAGVMITISGCSNLNEFRLPKVNLGAPTGKDVFTAASYYGKQLPSGFFMKEHGPAENSGAQLRGFHFGKRHWSF